MWPGEAPHSAHYPDVRYFDTNFREMYWVQNYNTAHGWARHVFQGELSDDGGKIMEREIKAVAASSMPLNFQIVRATKQPVPGPLQYHFVIGWHITTERQKPPKLEVITAPLLSKMDLESKQRHFWRERLDQMVGEIVHNDHGYLRIFADTVEKSLPVPEFVRLRQTGITDWQFIRSAIMPRARSQTNPKKAGYELFSLDGREVWFCTQGFRFLEYKPDPAQFFVSDEENSSWSVMDLGGSDFNAAGYDHYSKEGLTSKDGAGTSVSGARSAWVPIQTQAGLDSWVRAHAQQLNQKIYGFAVKLRGDVGFRGPANLSVNNTRSTRTGPIVSIRHHLVRGIYTMEVLAESATFPG